MGKNMNAKVTLIRHGETEWNHKGMQQGVLNSDLTDVGVRQAKATADALSRHGSFDEMYASPLGRATQTADIVGAFSPGEISIIYFTSALSMTNRADKS